MQNIKTGHDIQDLEPEIIKTLINIELDYIQEALNKTDSIDKEGLVTIYNQLKKVVQMF